MSQRKIMTQLQLKKNHKGTFCADIELADEQLTAYLSNKVIDAGQLYTSPLEGECYWACVNVNNGKAFINQLLPFTEHLNNATSIEYRAHCQRLKDGRIQLDLEQNGGCITLPKKAVYSWLYRIFYNSHVIVTFAHDANFGGDFVVENWQLQNAIRINKGKVTNIHIRDEDSGQYQADYYVDDTYTPVIFYKSDIQKLGIDSVTNEACLSANISFDDAKKRNKVTLSASPEKLLEAFNQPKAKLIFRGIEHTKKGHEVYKFVTQRVNGIRLNVSAWSSELDCFVDDISKFKQDDSIKAHLTYQQNAQWCNFKLPVAEADEYNERFRCITMKTVKNESMALLETCKAPYNRVLLASSELIKNGIFAIKSDVEFKLHIKRDSSKNKWEINFIDGSLFEGLKSSAKGKSKCTIISSWSRYKNAPEYVLKNLDRNYKSYAFSNHCMAKVSNNYADLLLVIPKELLAKRGFRTLAPNDILEVIWKKIEFPIFEKKPIAILCADRLLSHEVSQQSNDNGIVVYIDILEKLPSVKSPDNYHCVIVDSEDDVELTDWQCQLDNIAEASQYRYKVRIREAHGRRYVKEIISASIK